jgi:hypothetical protein
MDNPIYLGDGVYAKFENQELMLRQSAPANRITDEMINTQLSKS